MPADEMAKNRQHRLREADMWQERLHRWMTGGEEDCIRHQYLYCEMPSKVYSASEPVKVGGKTGTFR